MTDFLKNSPLYISTTIKHYLNGPPRPSWNLTSHIFWTKFILLVSNKTIEEMQRASFSFQPSPVQAGVVINEFKIDNKYRNEAQVHLDKILKPYEHVLDPEWKNLKDDGMASTYYFFTKKTYHCITSSLAKIANERVLAINYRLAPQNQFPAALHDALAAYLYLLNPPKDAGFEPLNPKNIVIAGDSAGGG
ncbi:alpha/beta hydrolase protein [Rhizophagus irregularis DAOM 181602=DAOM 197198]|uniref:Alpha/beta hydrolase fold-3 domain-containing protein n=1 Tax=Rhizophagus irregularis (strain DAOM 181602 / DAOM 197198 / MUCL 43194) TaxID=747089 RepID=A0A2P4PDH5_RHIID|nr:hypothetical protein GLOIN_2v1882125 [Rhizophagus irregularis DAOM 181602=DAOM 197198]POG63444.1 hypothetical protein GLOIN_2v1882125 [Rhizophagus irregularis DAOM 181602=DAOM 197198]GBC47006.2 alpha/beta hydrolase protein [Rhizophagus irregularis DAOM 181602=DAOM 197198]|eukprot:XP_025170310.1 hypothetical protein GLOIN_2v1882125 [Rhizophagus irregularis DAOM 181602=DAOM 197198]